VNQYGQFLLIRGYATLESDQALFVFCVYAIQELHMEMGSALSICAWFVSVVLVAAALVWFID